MGDFHYCIKESKIAVMEAAVESHERKIGEMQEEINELRESNAEKDKAIQVIAKGLEKIGNSVEGAIKTIDQWTGGLRVVIWFSGFTATLLSGAVLAVLGYYLSTR